MTIVNETTTPPCIFEPEVFHDEHLHGLLADDITG